MGGFCSNFQPSKIGEFWKQDEEENYFSLKNKMPLY